MKRVLAAGLVIGCGAKATPPAVPAPDHALHVVETREGDGLHLRVDGTGVPSTTLTLPAWFYIPLSGDLDVHVDLVMPHTTTRDLSVATGTLAVTCHDCTLGDPSQTPKGPGITSSHFEAIEAHVTVTAGVAMLVSWTAPSADIESHVTAHATLANPPETSQAQVCVRFRPTAMTFSRHSEIGEVLTSIGIEIDDANLLSFTLAGYLDELQLQGYGCDGHPQPPPPPEAPLPPPTDGPAPMQVEVTAADTDHVSITRDAWTQLITNPAPQAAGIRIVPSMKDGRPNGFKLYAIRPSSTYAKLGLANGDTITEANGYPLTGSDDELRAIADKLKDVSAVELVVIRRGKPRAIAITIQ